MSPRTLADRWLRADLARAPRSSWRGRDSCGGDVRRPRSARSDGLRTHARGRLRRVLRHRLAPGSAYPTGPAARPPTSRMSCSIGRSPGVAGWRAPPLRLPAVRRRALPPAVEATRPPGRSPPGWPSRWGCTRAHGALAIRASGGWTKPERLTGLPARPLVRTVRDGMLAGRATFGARLPGGRRRDWPCGGLWPSWAGSRFRRSCTSRRWPCSILPLWWSAADGAMAEALRSGPGCSGWPRLRSPARAGCLDFGRLMAGYGRNGGSVGDGFRTIKYVDLRAFFRLLGIDRAVCDRARLAVGCPRRWGWSPPGPGPTGPGSDLTWSAASASRRS